MNARPKESQLQQRRVLRIQMLLAGHAMDGMRLKQVAEALQAVPSTVLRDLELMADEGFVERIPGRDEFWRLAPRPIQIWRATEQELARLRARLDDYEQRVTREP